MSLVTGLFSPVLLLNQRWSPPLRLQASHCSTFRIMCDVPSTAVFCSESIECFPGTASKFFLKLIIIIIIIQFIDWATGSTIRGSNPGRGKIFISLTNCSDRPWAHPINYCHWNSGLPLLLLYEFMEFTEKMMYLITFCACVCQCVCEWVPARVWRK